MDETFGAACASTDYSVSPAGKATPLVSRVFEAQQHAGVFGSLDLDDLGELAESYETAISIDAEDQTLPFVGRIRLYEPGRAISCDRELSLGEDLYLKDHAFVFAPDVKPLSSCLPVLPMTMSLEAMAEVAACLAPGEGLLGFENVTATRWIELDDTDTITLNLTANFMSREPSTGVTRLKASISTASQAVPAVQATVLFGLDYQSELTFEFSSLESARSFPRTGEQLYAERHMFHGPSFHCLHGDMVIGDNGALGELVVLPSEQLFNSTRSPQLLACPTLLDAVGQLMGVWALAHERFVFPIGLGRLELYSPTPPVGTLAPVRIEITDNQGKMLQANVEIQDGQGGVWMRIAGWRSWKFKWPERIVNFRRLPQRFLLSGVAPGVNLAPDSVFMTLSDGDLQGFDPTLLARYVLNEDETQRYRELKRFPQRQRQWLLGRVVVKDAIRVWLSKKTQSEDFLHPAGVSLSVDSGSGRPCVTSRPGAIAPRISIAHCEDRAVAVAQSEDVGVDIERIAKRDAATVEAFVSNSERILIDLFPPEEFDDCCTRLWCSKEAVAKLLGVGVGSLLRALEMTQVERCGKIVLKHLGSSRSFEVQTVRDEDFIIAYATLSKASMARDEAAAIEQNV
jgi:phosphopantetheinyl transferase